MLFFQTPANLADYLRENPPPSPSIVVAPESTFAGAKGEGLARFDRKAVVLGGLTAVVPRQTAAYDDRLASPPNAYAGLPRRTTVVYLLSLLDARGWAKATGPGLGLADLNGKSREILASILPRSLTWEKRHLDFQGLPDATLGQGTIPDGSWPKVRLRVQRSLDLMIPFVAGGGYLGVPTEVERGVPDTVRLDRLSEPAQENTTRFGFPMRSLVDNRLKRGQLDTGRLKGTVDLSARTTVGEALRLVGTSSGQEMLCDLRVSGLSVVRFGSGPIRAGALADALALAVGGTYRRIGPAYALVSDVTGLGQRQLRQLDWQEENQAKADLALDRWAHEIDRRGFLKGVPFDPANALGPKEALLPYLDRPGEIPVSDLTPEQRALIGYVRATRTPGSLRADRVAAQTSLRYRFVLPDGEALTPESDTLRLPAASPQALRASDAPSTPLPPSADGSATTLVVRLKDVAAARSALTAAQAHGVREMWVETENRDVLAMIAKGGIATRLVIRPWVWRVAKAPAFPDRNLLGYGGSDLVARLDRDREWNRRERSGLSANRPLEPIVSPQDPSWPARKAAWNALAQTPGLAGIVLLDSQPRGYEAGRTTTTVSGYGGVIATKSTLGYSESERLAFFRQFGVDPIDLGTPMLRGDIDLSAPFFSDDALASWAVSGASPPLVAEALVAWDRYRWRRNVAAIEDLLSGLPPIPIGIDVRAPAQNEPLGSIAVVEPWTSGKPLPARLDSAELRPNGREILTVGPEDDLANDRAYGSAAAGGSVLDLTLVPVKKMGARLDRMFRRKA